MATVEEIEDLIITRLAEQKRCDPADLRADLAAKGSDMPADSHRLVRVVFKLRRDLEIPPFKWDKSFKPAFKSVRLLAGFLYQRQSDSRAQAA
jgi:acyl carrier protein